MKLKTVLSSLEQFIAARVCRGLDDEFCNAQVLVRAERIKMTTFLVKAPSVMLL